MIKYELRKIKPDGYGGNHVFNVTVTRALLKDSLNNDWFIIRRKYFIITSFLDWWKNLSDGNKITFSGIIFTGFLTFSLWGLSEYFQYKNSNLKIENSSLIKRFDSLKKSHDSLNLNFELLKQRFHYLNDSLNQKNKIIENLKSEIKPKKTSGKK
jgi:hypothetical protein